MQQPSPYPVTRTSIARVAAIAFLFFLSALSWLLPLMNSTYGAAIQTSTTATIVSAANYQAPLAPNSVASLFSVGMTTQTVTASTKPLPTTLAGVSVTVNGTAAGLFYVSPLQINFLVPATTALGNATVVVRASDNTTRTGTVEIVNAAPALFTANASGLGVAAAVAMRVKANNVATYEPILQFDNTSNSFQPLPLNLGPTGERLFLVLYASGARNVTSSLRVMIGGVEVTPSFAGAAPDFFGLEQINAEIPRSLAARGRLNITLLAANVRTSNVAETEIANLPNTGTGAPIINTITPTKPVAGELITLTGSGFSTPASANTLIIGGVETRAIESASATQLVVRVPYGIATNKILVRTTLGEGGTLNTVIPVTSISGLITDTQGNPLPNVDVSYTNKTAKTRIDGSYTIKDVTPGLSVLRVDASVLPLTPKFTIFSRLLATQANRDNLQAPIALQPPSNNSILVQTQNSVAAQASGPSLASAQLPFETLGPIAIEANTTHGGITFDLPDTSIATLPVGITEPRVYLTRIENSRAPVNFPAGVYSSALAQLSPFGIKFSTGGKLTFPNTDSLPANAQVTLYRLNQTATSASLGNFVAAGTATVSADGQRVETTANAITETTIFFVATPRPTSTVLGRVVDSDTKPVRFAFVTCAGQNALTDGNGNFAILNVPVPVNGQLTVEVAYFRPNGRTDRVARTGITGQALTVTRVTPDIVLPSAATQPNRAPSLTAPPTLIVNESSTRDFPLLVSDPDLNHTVSVSVSGATFASIVSNQGAFTLRLAPGSGTVGNYTLTIRASDNQTPSAATTRIVAVSVIGNRAPSLGVPGAQTVNAGQTLSFNLKASDPDELQTLTFSSSNLPTGATLTPTSATTARFNWTPNTSQAGTLALNLTVRDNGTPALSDNKTVPISIIGATGIVRGVIRNAQTGLPLAGATLSVANTSLTTTSAADGTYTIGNVPSGARTLTASLNGYTTTQLAITITANQTLTLNLSLSPNIALGQIRITLNWAKDADITPNDLDAHLTGPTVDSGCFHVDFTNEGALDLSPFAELEVDNIELPNSPPTETIRISQRIAGVYRFFVHNYEFEKPDGLSTSRATVQIFSDNQLLRTFVVPNGAGEYWEVFTLDGQTGAITEINQLGNSEPALNCGELLQAPRIGLKPATSNKNADIFSKAFVQLFKTPTIDLKSMPLAIAFQFSQLKI